MNRSCSSLLFFIHRLLLVSCEYNSTSSINTALYYTYVISILTMYIITSTTISTSTIND